MYQTKYVHKILEKIGMQNCKPIYTLVEVGLKMSMYDAREPFDVHIYVALAGCLIYLASNTCPNIHFGVSQASRFMHILGTKHWQAMKHILCYLTGALDYALFFL